MKKVAEPKAICPFCEKKLTPYTPRGGDGSAEFFRAHKNQEGKRCNGWARMVRPEDYVREP